MECEPALSYPNRRGVVRPTLSKGVCYLTDALEVRPAKALPVTEASRDLARMLPCQQPTRKP